MMLKSSFVRVVACLMLSAGAVVTSAASFQQAAAVPAAATLANAADQQFSSGGATIRYRDTGTGEAIVFVHGYSAALESMLAVANALPPDYRKVALDVRGFGRSSKLPDAASYGQAMVDDVVRLMDHLTIQRAHLVGHSMGALIAANVAARYPARVISTTLVAGPFWGEPAITTESNRWSADLEAGKGLVNFLQWLFPGMNEPMAASTNAGVMKANDLAALTGSMRSLPALALTGLPKGGARTLLVAGTVDPLFPLSTAFAQQSPGSRMIEVAGANHISVLTTAEAVKGITELIRR